MIRWLGLWRLVVGRVRSDGPFLAATWLLVASALTLLAAGTLYGETVEAGGVRRALLEAAPHERGVAVRLAAAPAELGELDRSVRDTLVSAFGDAATETVLVIRSG